MGSNPGFHGRKLVLITTPPRTHVSSLIHASVAERLWIPALDRGIPGSIPGDWIFRLRLHHSSRLWIPARSPNRSYWRSRTCPWWPSWSPERRLRTELLGISRTSQGCPLFKYKIRIPMTNTSHRSTAIVARGGPIFDRMCFAPKRIIAVLEWCYFW